MYMNIFIKSALPRSYMSNLFTFIKFLKMWSFNKLLSITKQLQGIGYGLSLSENFSWLSFRFLSCTITTSDCRVLTLDMNFKESKLFNPTVSFEYIVFLTFPDVLGS